MVCIMVMAWLCLCALTLLSHSYDLGDPDLRYAPLMELLMSNNWMYLASMEETQKAKEAEEKVSLRSPNNLCCVNELNDSLL